MKKSGEFFVLALVSLFLFSSCEKEGVYNPKQKIDRIYYSAEINDHGETFNIDKLLKEEWNWNGNLLESIAYYDDEGNQAAVETYEYDGDRLVRIHYGYEGRYEFEYDGKRLSSVKCYAGDAVVNEVEVIHDGKKIVALNVTEWANDFYSETLPMRASVLRHLVPNISEQAANQLLAQTRQANEKMCDIHYSFLFEWDGKNISKITETGDAGTQVFEYTYDNMKNPFKGLFDINELEFYSLCVSENNVLSETIHLADTLIVGEYTFTYDGKYPVTRSWTRTDSYGFGDEYSETFTYYYEYK